MSGSPGEQYSFPAILYPYLNLGDRVFSPQYHFRKHVSIYHIEEVSDVTRHGHSLKKAGLVKMTTSGFTTPATEE